MSFKDKFYRYMHIELYFTKACWLKIHYQKHTYLVTHYRNNCFNIQNKTKAKRYLNKYTVPTVLVTVVSDWRRVRGA